MAGSAGCIDLTGRMGEFARLIAPYAAAGCKIQLTVVYPAVGDFPLPTGETRTA